MEENLLVSYVICTYNQQNTIAEAIRSAFSQTYSPLEIIISDDASTDNTVLRIREAVLNYTGCHKVVVNLNKANQGIAKHWDSISRTANGRLIVHAAGDDVSMCHRVSTIVEAWSSMNPQPILISSNGLRMSYDGRDLDPLETDAHARVYSTQYGPINNNFDLLEVPVIGFSLVIDSILYKKFPPLSFWMLTEDEIMRARAMQIGPMAYMSEILVKYRDGGVSKALELSRNKYIQRLRDQAISRLNYVMQLIIDLNHLNGGMLKYERDCLVKLNLAVKEVQLANGGNFFRDLYILIIFILNRNVIKVSKKECVAMFGVNHMQSVFFVLKKIKSIYAK